MATTPPTPTTMDTANSSSPLSSPLSPLDVANPTGASPPTSPASPSSLASPTSPGPIMPPRLNRGTRGKWVSFFEIHRYLSSLLALTEHELVNNKNTLQAFATYIGDFAKKNHQHALVQGGGKLRGYDMLDAPGHELDAKYARRDVALSIGAIAEVLVEEIIDSFRKSVEKKSMENSSQSQHARKIRVKFGRLASQAEETVEGLNEEIGKTGESEVDGNGTEVH